MENTPEAPAEAPKAPESEAPQTTNEPAQTQAQTPDMYGFTSEHCGQKCFHQLRSRRL